MTSSRLMTAERELDEAMAWAQRPAADALARIEAHILRAATLQRKARETKHG